MAKPKDMNKFAKPENPIATIKRLLGFIKDKLPIICFVLVLTVASSLLSVYAAHLVSPIIQSIGEMANNYCAATLKTFVGNLIKLGCTYGLVSVVGYFSSFLMVKVTNNTLNKIRNTLFTKMQKLPLSFFDRKPNGELMSYYTNDVGAIRDAISDGIVTVVSGFATLVFTFVMMLMISPLLTLAIIVLIATMTFLTKFIGSRSIKNFKSQQESVAKLNGYMEELMAGQKVVKVFNHEDKTMDEFNEINENARKSSTKANIFASIMMPLSNNLNHINYAICSMIGAFMVIKGTISLAQLIEFLQHTKNFSQPLSRIAQQFNSLTRAVAGAERIFKVLDMEDEVDEGKTTLVYATYNENNELVQSKLRTGLWAWKTENQDGSVTLTRLRGDVKFTNVDFSYDGKKQVLNNVSFYAKPGQKIAFVGATGAGKTTITNLINRFYDINDGEILYDGINVKDIKKASLRSSLSMVLQDTHIFTGTIKDCIRYGKLTATDEEIVEAAKLANAHEFITMLPEGYDTMLTGDGANLSQGQRQLLAIARAMIADAPVLILDEATSSIDTRTEKLIEEGMDNLMAGRTVFVIAHRLSTVRNSNAIIVLDHGNIIERGDHDDLISQKGQYYKLYTGQFELD